MLQVSAGYKHFQKLLNLAGYSQRKLIDKMWAIIMCYVGVGMGNLFMVDI